jgi:hypothetical protein
VIIPAHRSTIDPLRATGHPTSARVPSSKDSNGDEATVRQEISRIFAEKASQMSGLR